MKKLHLIIMPFLFLPLSAWAYTPEDPEVDLSDEFTFSSKAQGKRNTCSAFAANALLEYVLFQKNGQRVEASFNYTYFSAKAGIQNPGIKKIYEHKDALAGYLAVEGVARSFAWEQDWPYFNENGHQLGKLNCLHKTEAFSACLTGTPSKDLKAQTLDLRPLFIPREQIADYILEQKKPVVMNICWDKERVDVQGNFSMPPNGELSSCAGHVILLTGFSPLKKAFHFKNSWGAAWGNKGFGTIPEEYVNKFCEACHLLRANQGLELSDSLKELLSKSALGVSLE